MVSAEEDNPESLIHERVTSDDIARVISRMTGIPVRVCMMNATACNAHPDILINCIYIEFDAWRKREAASHGRCAQTARRRPG